MNLARRVDRMPSNLSKNMQQHFYSPKGRILSVDRMLSARNLSKSMQPHYSTVLRESTRKIMSEQPSLIYPRACNHTTLKS